MLVHAEFGPVYVKEMALTVVVGVVLLVVLVTFFL